MNNSIKAFGSRFAALLLCLCMVFTMIPSAYAADEEDDDLIGANIQDGVLVGYYGPGGDIVIPIPSPPLRAKRSRGTKKSLPSPSLAASRKSATAPLRAAPTWRRSSSPIPRTALS